MNVGIANNLDNLSTNASALLYILQTTTASYQHATHTYMQHAVNRWRHIT